MTNSISFIMWMKGHSGQFNFFGYSVSLLGFFLDIKDWPQPQLPLNCIQWTPDNSNLQGKSKRFELSGDGFRADTTDHMYFHRKN